MTDNDTTQTGEPAATTTAPPSDSAPPAETVIDAPPADDPRIAQLTAQLEQERQQRESDRQYFSNMMQRGPQPQQAQPEVPFAELVRQRLQGDAAEPLAKLFAEFEQRMTGRFAGRADVDEVRGMAQQSYLTVAEQKLMQDYKARNVSEDDFRAARDRAYANAKEAQRNGRQLPPLDYAIRAELSDVLLEKQATQAGEISRKKAAVQQRAAQAGTPQASAPAVNGKTTIDRKALRGKSAEQILDMVGEGATVS